MKENKINNNNDLLTLILPSERDGFYLIKKELVDQFISTDTLIDEDKITLVIEGLSSNEKKAYRSGYKKGYRVAYAAVLRFIKLYSMASSAKLK